MAEHLDVVVIGAGLSGINAAWHLQRHCPSKTYAILERRADLGGTWDLFRYPGVRCDSDMFTLAYRFKPWTSTAMTADGAAIKAYINDAAVENGIAEHIRYHHRVIAADWSDAEARWRLTVEHDGRPVELTCSFLFACSGYYDYDRGYTPDFAGADDFTGVIIHPQHWPEDFDYTGEKIVVIGSGATTITLVPALADGGAGNVTMLQRSPSYIAIMPRQDRTARRVNRVLPRRLAAKASRWYYILNQIGVYRFSQRFPYAARRFLMWAMRRELPGDYDADTHFAPHYNPWDQRLCVDLDGELFRGIRDGRIDVVTDAVDRFTATGVRLVSGTEVAADVIVTATGLNVQLFGGARLSRNGVRVNPADTMAYRSMMLTGCPNLAFTVGYANASWTLKADLVSRYVTRLLNHMDAHELAAVEPAPPAAGVERRPLMEMTSGYLRRAYDSLPKSGVRPPWRLRDNYLLDRQALRRARFDRGGLRFVPSARTSPKPSVIEAGSAQAVAWDPPA